ncbi:hypothetical protein KR222_009419, partial [Zaprionus bogoriensis]
RMLLEEFCVKVYFWPFLSYLASIKGLCPLYPTGYYPVYPLPPPFAPPAPLTPSTYTSTAVIPTFQPTPPFPQTPITPPLPPTTLSTTSTTSGAVTTTTTSSSSSSTSTTTGSSTTSTTCPTLPFVCLPGGMPPLPNCPCIDPRQQQQQQSSSSSSGNAPLVASTLGSDMMVFVPLNPSRRRRRRQRQQAQLQACYDAHARAGSCQTLPTCQHLLEEYQSDAGSSDFQTFLGQSICGFDGSSFLVSSLGHTCCDCCLIHAFNLQVCCAAQRAPLVSRSPKDYHLPSTSPANGPLLFASLSGATTQNPLQQPQHQQQPVVFQPTPPLNQAQIVVRPSTVPLPVAPPSNTMGCGIGAATSNRVVGGLPARKGAYPWVAALGYYDESNRNALKFLCAGSLISSHFVITSAHCINPTLTLVRLGAQDLSRSAEPGAMDFRIRRTIVNEKFNLASIANDIALIELHSEAPSSDTIRPICLPESSRFQREDEFVGMNPFVAGFGATKHQGATSNVLRDAQVPIVSRQSCEQSYKSVFQFVQFSDKLICAGSSTVDACQGDSGGPLMMPQLDGGIYRYYLLGIVSFGYECAKPGFPGVYTRTASYLNWIHGILRGT